MPEEDEILNHTAPFFPGNINNIFFLLWWQSGIKNLEKQNAEKPKLPPNLLHVVDKAEADKVRRPSVKYMLN